MNLLAELLSPTPTGDIDGLVVEAVHSIPLDPPPPWEGDDSVHHPDSKLTPIVFDPRDPRFEIAQAVPAQARVVPFVRTLHAGNGGPDVVAVQRALRAAKVRRIRPSGWYGPIMVRNVKAFQAAHGISQSGVYGPATHDRLRSFFDAYGAFLMARAKQKQHEAQVRALIVATALFGVSVREQSHYSQGSHRLDALTMRLKPPKFPTETDCSGFADWTYQVADGPDPAGADFNPGAVIYTGTQSRHGRQVQVAQPGDLCFYGPAWPYKHVTVAISSTRCVSDGSESGPAVYEIHYRDDFAQIRSYF